MTNEQRKIDAVFFQKSAAYAWVRSRHAYSTKSEKIRWQKEQRVLSAMARRELFALIGSDGDNHVFAD